MNTQDIASSELISPSDTVIEIACGDLHTLIKTVSKKLYTCGYGAHYALGHGDTENSYTPRQINSFDGTNIIKIACGSNMSGGITHEGQVFQWGLVCKQDKSKTYYKQPTQILLEKGALIGLKKKTAVGLIDIKMGDCFTLVLTENVFS